MNVFICHASEQADLGRNVEMALRGEGHTTFLDRSALTAGETYDEPIRTAIAEADLLVFLISPASVAKGRYTLNELELAERKWTSPAGRVLPVMVEATDLATVPAYLRAVTILEPAGNVAAAVVAAVDRLARPPWRRALRSRAGLLVLAALLATAGAAAWGYRHLATRAEVARLVTEGTTRHAAADYPAAWDVLGRARALAPGRRDVSLAQERLAMDWLENIRVTVGKDTFTGIVEKVQPVLLGCAASGEGRRAADCTAHLGWGDFLRTREGVSGLDPARSYRQALALDPDNAYANAMLGFHVLQARREPSEARSLFARALASGRNRAAVRLLQLAALLYYHNPALEEEAVRVVDGIRQDVGSRPLSAEDHVDRWRLWNIYYDRVVNGTRKVEFLSALPAADHLTTFRWLFPADAMPPDKRALHLFMGATLQEQAGQHAAALAGFRELRGALARDGVRGGRLAEGSEQAISRLSKER